MKTLTHDNRTVRCRKPRSRLIQLLFVTASLGNPFNPPNSAAAQPQSPPAFTITITQPINGTITVTPPIPAGGKVPAGTVLTVKISPAPGFAIDSGYSTVRGPWS